MPEEALVIPELVIPGITDKSALASIARARKYSQFVKAVENALKGFCPFCTIDPTYNTIVAENDYWVAWPCKPPEDNTAFHFLFVPKRHVTDSEELTDVETLALWSPKNGIRTNVRRKFGYTSRGTLMRDGDATMSAGTIQHLHVHDMVPNGTGRVESPFYKGFLSEREGFCRAIVFEKLRTGTSKDDLLEVEKTLVDGRL